MNKKFIFSCLALASGNFFASDSRPSTPSNQIGASGSSQTTPQKRLLKTTPPPALGTQFASVNPSSCKDAEDLSYDRRLALEGVRLMWDAEISDANLPSPMARPAVSAASEPRTVVASAVTTPVRSSNSRIQIDSTGRLFEWIVMGGGMSKRRYLTPRTPISCADSDDDEQVCLRKSTSPKTPENQLKDLRALLEVKGKRLQRNQKSIYESIITEEYSARKDILEDLEIAIKMTNDEAEKTKCYYELCDTKQNESHIAVHTAYQEFMKMQRNFEKATRNFEEAEHLLRQVLPSNSSCLPSASTTPRLGDRDYLPK